MNTSADREIGDGGVIRTLASQGEGIFLSRVRRQKADANASATVLAVSERTSSGGFSRLVREYELAKYLDASFALQPLELIQENAKTTLLLEDSGGGPLSQLLGKPMEVELFLRLAIGITAAVGKMHQQGLIHKDIKPANIFLDRAGEHVWLTGFGIASRLPRERQVPEPPEAIAGTLAYMAPEQTGRMNRSIDSRSDLYSLGVTLYQMLTGVLPFLAADPMEWVHCHIARKPLAPDQGGGEVPTALSDIVMKLLAKMAEERYQTAAALEQDLRQCATQWENKRRIEPFALGRHEPPGRLLIPEKLYGRDQAIATLQRAFDSVVRHPTTALILVTGYTGIGKSSVVNELHKALVPPRGLFASGKFDQHKRDIPYATLAQAFQRLIRPILAKNEVELARWRESLLRALEPNGALIVDLVPELRLIVGEPGPVSELPALDAQRRIQLLLRRFIAVFACPERPLALFLDDLQWLDAATLDLLEYLLTQEGVPHLLLIGAYRDNEVDASHPLMRKLTSIRAAGVSTVEEIRLGALDSQQVSQLISDALHCGADQVADLAQLILQKTDGNPFFINQFLSTLMDEGLITFDARHSRWSWDLKRIHAKGYTDNVVDLMIGKLVRLPAATREALQQLACLGNVASATILAIIHDITEQELHARLIEACRHELVDALDSSYRFVHDRVQEAAYALIVTERRPAVHLRIGRTLVAHTPPGKLQESIFEIVNQLNRALVLVTAPEERERLAEFNLLAGRRAQASSAYVSALNYLTTGAALLTEESWQQHRELRFSLELARAHCEFATGKIVEAEERLRGLSARAVTRAERVAVACLQVDLYQGSDRSDRAVAVGLSALRHLGIEIPERPSEADAQHAYDAIWTRLNGREIEDLVHLPLMSDQESLAALDLLIRVAVPGFFDSYHLFAVAVCTAVCLGLERGHSDASCIAYAQLATMAGPHFGQFDAGYRFGRLGCELVERAGLQRYQARTFETFGFVVPWTQHVRKGREYLFRGFDLASRIGEISYAGYACGQLNTNYLMAGDPLIETQKQAEQGLAFARKVRFGMLEGWILGQLGLIRSLRGLTSRLGFFDEGVISESELERHLADNPALELPECWYYIRKLQARFFAGEYLDALQAASKAQPMLWHSVSLLEVVEYHFYDALCHAAIYEAASPEAQKRHRAALVGHLEVLETWGFHCQENFATRAALVGAELARIEGREFDAERQYERAISLAAAAGLDHNEALASELAGRFHLARGFERIAKAYLREARDGYLRWGADGKVQQLDRLYPYLAAAQVQHSAATSASVIEQLDVASVVKASQALSSEIVLPKLIERLMVITIENAGADRGLLILPSGDEHLIQAEARTIGDQVEVAMLQEPITGNRCPESLVRYVIRTRENVILDDASKPNLFSADDYLRDRQSRSVLCVALIKQQELTGILLLENTLTSHAFTPVRIAILELLAAQAAISLENTRLYGDLQEREAKVRRLVDSNIIGICIFDFDGRIMEANDEFLRIVEYGREDLVSGSLRWTDLTPPEWAQADDRALAEVAASGACRPYEKEFVRKDESRVPVLMAGANFSELRRQGVAFALDLTERKRAEAELAHANRVATMGQLAASIAHEVNQPIAAALLNADNAARWLCRQPPNLEKTKQSIDRIVSDGRRAAAIVSRTRDFFRKAPARKEKLEINAIVLEVMGLTRFAMSENGVVAKTQLAKRLPLLLGDSVQLQQVILNLVMNAIEALRGVNEELRTLLIWTGRAEPDGLLVTISDSGAGLPQADPEQIFDAFYTTKADGLGMGLSICRSIVEAHGGQLWATPNQPRGAIFSLILPIGERSPENPQRSGA